ncbi:MAG: non-ribosomal peptide synthetase module [Syntrophomonadaceae bacterium]|nr:non-ribosomal peptide synthetase module [Syntrophomonadaceae bacterium]
MLYDERQVTAAFRLYASLVVKGYGDKEALRLYLADDIIRGLVEVFAQEVECTVIPAGDQLLLIPLALSSPFHISNQSLKERYLPSRATNADIYLMYVAIIVFFGEFYDSYQTDEPTQTFLSLDHWLDRLNERLLALKEIDPDELERMEQAQEYNWRQIVEQWDALDDLKEKVKAQDARTNSRLAFLNTVKRFMEDQGLVKDVGADELELTEKARTIIQRYYMEAEHNQSILEFIYQAGQGKELD